MLDAGDERQISETSFFFSLHMEVTLWHCDGGRIPI